jgi:hypothetical protein
LEESCALRQRNRKAHTQSEHAEEKGRSVYSIQLEGFEFKLRERVVLKVIQDRGSQLPPARLEE